VAAPAVAWGPAAGMKDRRGERAALDRFVQGVQAGEGHALVVRGEPGVGKTALLDYLAGRASQCRVVRAVGVQSEMELAFAGLHQLCGPMLDRAGSLPASQRDALRTAFGVSAGPPPDRFLVGLAVLGLLSEVAGDQPLICVVDDEQWLDRASAQALGFTARRLAADPVGLIFAARVPGEELAGLPGLVVPGLGEADSRSLLESVLTGPLEEMQAAQLEYLRAQIAYDRRRGSESARLLHGAARRFEPLDAALAREIHLEALTAALFSGLEVPAAQAVAQAALAAPPAPGPPRPVDVVLDAFALLATRGYPAAEPLLRQALDLLLTLDTSGAEVRRWLFLGGGRAGTIFALDRGDWEALAALATRQAQAARAMGALVQLRFAITFLGEFAAAARLIEEERLIAEATGTPPITHTAILLAGWRGREQELADLIEAAAPEGVDRELTLVAMLASCAGAVLDNGLGRPESAAEAAWQAWQCKPILAAYAVPELVEAAARTGDLPRARAALNWLAERTRVAPATGWALGIEARARALLSDDATAEACYQESIGHLAATRCRLQLARSHLLYGEWLRRRKRRLDAREQLRTAYDMLSAMGAQAFADRARRELLATGETASKRATGTDGTAGGPLTAQEASVAQLAVDGLTNPEIGARLYISARTVQYHLRKVFTKLAITSRHELKQALEGLGKAIS
jgi:DNA-binding CsgD family transcriptional regulator